MVSETLEQQDQSEPKIYSECGKCLFEEKGDPTDPDNNDCYFEGRPDLLADNGARLSWDDKLNSLIILDRKCRYFVPKDYAPFATKTKDESSREVVKTSYPRTTIYVIDEYQTLTELKNQVERALGNEPAGVVLVTNKLESTQMGLELIAESENLKVLQCADDENLRLSVDRHLKSQNADYIMEVFGNKSIPYNILYTYDVRANHECERIIAMYGKSYTFMGKSLHYKVWGNNNMENGSQKSSFEAVQKWAADSGCPEGLIRYD